MIAKLLVANRGEIARRIMRTCREMGIATVAVFSDPDADAPFVREADEAVALGGASAEESYLRADSIVAAARHCGADAVHPGYGFLAENAGFARACAEAGLTFVGPSPDAIAAMGSKVEAKRLMADAGVPVMPGAELPEASPDTATGSPDTATASPDAAAASPDTTATPDAELAAAAERVGFPLLVKASAGGGGKGMRVVRSPEELGDALTAARREAAAAFGDETVFLERYLETPRHVEVQIVGDDHGRVVHLFERECSIQRRYQKLIEESPSPAVDPELRRRMGEAAVAAGEAIGYVGAGTVEFLLVPSGEFFFLEMNTRLQVEHPVTELVTGLDLVRLQLLVAGGAPLPGEALEARSSGHAIEARLYAEDPERDFLPGIGTLRRFAPPAIEGLRVDSGVEHGSEISPHYDSLLAKVIAHGPDRAEAARRLAAALERAELHGPRTNRDLLVRLLRHPDFLAGDTDTGFLERHPPAELGAPLLDGDGERLHAAAAALALQAERRASAHVLASLPSGWRNNPSGLQEVTFEGARGALSVGYRFTRDGLVLQVGEQELERPSLASCSAELVDLEVGGVRRRYRVRCYGDRVFVNSGLGQCELRELARFPSAEAEQQAGSLVSPMPGAVLRVGAEQGAQVERGDVLVVIEAMKMEHEIVAPATGTLSDLRVAAGDQVDTGTVLVVIDETGSSDG